MPALDPVREPSQYRVQTARHLVGHLIQRAVMYYGPDDSMDIRDSTLVEERETVPQGSIARAMRAEGTEALWTNLLCVQL